MEVKSALDGGSTYMQSESMSLSLRSMGILMIARECVEVTFDPDI